MILEATPLPYGPWEALAWSGAFLVLGLLLAGQVVHARNRAHARVGYAGYRTPWWRLRIIGPRWVPMSAGAVTFFSWSLLMASVALYEWTGFLAFAVTGALAGLGGAAYFWVEWVIAVFTDKYDDLRIPPFS